MGTTFAFSDFYAVPVYADRADYVSKKGVQPADFDATKPPKMWEDYFQVGVSSNATYQTIQQLPGSVSGPLAQVVSFTIPASEAAAPNIPGLQPRNYPVWAPAQTNATTDGKNLVELQVLSTAAQAAALAAQFPGSTVIGGNTLQPSVDELGRSDWMLHGGGLSSDEYVGTLLAVQYAPGVDGQYAGGVGAPGQWSVLNGAAIWRPVPLPPDGINPPSTLPAVPIPTDPLPPGATFVPGAVPGSVEISTAPPVTGAGGGLTASQAAALAAIPGMQATLNQIAGKFGIPPAS
jgi:hypothetical protein